VSQSPTASALAGTAECDTGDFVINGGYTYSGSVSDSTVVLGDFPVNDIIIPTFINGSGWNAVITGLPPSPANNFRVYASCFDNPPAHIP